jgi:hypothetical protein
MTAVTVLVPAYMAEGFIAETVRSVLRQSFSDLRLEVGIDPPADGSPDRTAEALARFKGDARMKVRKNRQRLGWAENVNALMARVDTPFFAILPHDDLWGPGFLAAALAGFAEQPDAVAVYGDLLRFGARPPGRISLPLPPGEPQARQILHFLAGGCEGMVFHALLRSGTIATTGGFPTDRHRGFAVECEHALAVHAAGPVVHLPRVFYFKRAMADDVITAARARLQYDLAGKSEAWAEHARRMAAILAGAVGPLGAEAGLYGAALTGAMMRRWQRSVDRTLPGAHLDRIGAALAVAEASADAMAGRLRANLHLVLQQHHLSLGDRAAAREAVGRAFAAAPELPLALFEEARAVAAERRPLEALELAAEALRLGQGGDTLAIRELIDRIYRAQGWLPE